MVDGEVPAVADGDSLRVGEFLARTQGRGVGGDTQRPFRDGWPGREAIATRRFLHGNQADDDAASAAYEGFDALEVFGSKAEGMWFSAEPQQRGVATIRQLGERPDMSPRLDEWFETFKERLGAERIGAERGVGRIVVAAFETEMEEMHQAGGEAHEREEEKEEGRLLHAPVLSRSVLAAKSFSSSSVTSCGPYQLRSKVSTFRANSSGIVASAWARRWSSRW